MKDQIFIGDRPMAGLMHPVENDMLKPRGGLWTSTHMAEEVSPWLVWCLGNDFRHKRGDVVQGWLLKVKDSAKVYEIDSEEDYKCLKTKYPADTDLSISGVDWVAVGKDYDGVHITPKGEYETRYLFPKNLYGWDCESTLWYRWVFESVEALGDIQL